MAVAVDDCPALQSRKFKPVAVGFFFKEFGKSECVLHQLVRTFGVREKAVDLVAKNGAATGLKHDNRSAGVEFGAEDIHHTLEISFRQVEETVVIERASAAKVLFGDDHRVSSAFEDVDCSDCRLGKKIIIESVRPENYVLARIAPGTGIQVRAGGSEIGSPVFMLLKPRLECFCSKGRNLSLLRHASGKLRQAAKTRQLGK